MDLESKARVRFVALIARDPVPLDEAALSIGQPDALRDRGLVAARLGATASAVRDLEAYLARAGGSADAGEARRVLAALRERPPALN